MALSLPFYYPVGKNGKREPNEKQKIFHQSNHKFRGYCSGVGAGKTTAGCYEAIKQAYLFPKSLILIGNNTVPQLRDSTMRTFWDMCPPQLIKSYNKTENILEFLNGSEIIFRSFDDYSKFQGLELSAFFMDEASESPEEIFSVLTQRLRNKNTPAGYHRGWVCTNPNGKNWVYNRFFNNPSKDYLGITATTYENKDNLPEGYIEMMLEAFSEDWVSRFIFGSFDTFSGQIFQEFHEDVHVVDAFEIPAHWYRFRAMDFGWSHPTAVLWAAEDPEGNLYIYQELYKKNLSSHDLAMEVNAMSPKGEVYEYTVGDTSGAAITQSSTESVFSQLYEYGDIQVIPAYKQDKLGRIDRVRKLFKHNAIRIFRNCTNLIRELPQYQWETPKLGQAANSQRPRKVNDDAIDALMYLCGSRPDRFGLPPAQVRKPLTEWEMVNTAQPSIELAQRQKNKKIYY